MPSFLVETIFEVGLVVETHFCEGAAHDRHDFGCSTAIRTHVRRFSHFVHHLRCVDARRACLGRSISAIRAASKHRQDPRRARFVALGHWTGAGGRRSGRLGRRKYARRRIGWLERGVGHCGRRFAIVGIPGRTIARFAFAPPPIVAGRGHVLRASAHVSRRSRTYAERRRIRSVKPS